MKHTLIWPAAKLAAGLVVCATSVLAPSVSAFAATLPPAPYTVLPGNTAYTVAALANVGLNDFYRVNHLSKSSAIAVGEKVAMPFLYRVDAGDSLWYIARRYQTTAGAIRKLNGLSSNLIHPNQTLLLARGSVGAATWVATTTPRRLSGAATSTVAASTGGTGGQQTLTMTATSYDASAASNGPWGALNYFGQPLQFGDVAVDPSVIPLGTRLFISGYTDPALPRGGFYATANDVGGAIRGKRVDIFLPTASQANQFGVEQVHVQVVS
ncbi:MAG: LysM peptidoglycan-binding domain-containing protein [Bacilli bacterium]